MGFISNKKMMRINWVLLFSVLVSLSAYSQDDIPDYRNKRESFKKMLEKDIRSDLARFALGGLDEAISKDALSQMEVLDYSSNSIKFGSGNVTVTIVSGNFDKAKHKLLYYDEKYLIKIDNKAFYAIKPGDIPKKTIESVTVTFGRDTLRLPATTFNDLYEPVFCKANTSSNTSKCNSAVYLSADKRKIYIYMLNSDGSNGYEVTWVIQDKQYLRRVVDYGF